MKSIYWYYRGSDIIGAKDEDEVKKGKVERMQKRREAIRNKQQKLA